MKKRLRATKDRGEVEIVTRGYFDASGKPVTKLPNPMTGHFARNVFRFGVCNNVIVGSGENARIEAQKTEVRAQIPHLVTLLVYRSKLQMTPDSREYLVYAPADYKSAANAALMLWRRWEKGRPAEAVVDLFDINKDYPKVEDGGVCEPIDDKFFLETWNFVKNKPHKCAGDPRDPWAFTCLDPEVRIYRTEDPQAGMIHRIK